MTEIGLLVSILSIIIAISIYYKQSKHLYNVNYSRIECSNIEADIMNIQNKILDELGAFIDDVKGWLSKGNQSTSIDITEELYIYIKNLENYLSKYINNISTYISILDECNSFKHNNKVNNSISHFKKYIKQLKSQYVLLKFNGINNEWINFTFDSSSSLNDSFFESIETKTLDVNDFSKKIHKLMHNVMDVQRIQNSTYSFAIQDIKYIFNNGELEKEAYNYILDNYKNTISNKKTGGCT